MKKSKINRPSLTVKRVTTVLVPAILATGMPSKASAQAIQDNLHQSIPAKEIRLDARGNVIKDTLAEEVSSGFALGQYANTAADEATKGFSLSPYKVAGTGFRMKATTLEMTASEGPAYENSGTTGNNSPQVLEQEAKPGKKKKHGISPLVIIGGLAAVGAIVYLATKKKKDTPTPPPNQETTYSFEVYDQMEAGVHKTFDKKVKTGTPIPITTSETDIGDVVADYISVQDTSGNTLESSKTGTVTFTPVSGTKFKVIRYHAGPGFKEVYDWLASQKSLQLYAGRDSTWGRKDDTGVTGNENVWTGTINGVKGGLVQVNEVLANPFKLGSVTSGGTQNWYGFKIEAEGGKDLSQKWIYVNPTKVEPQQVRTALEEIIEYLGAVGNMLGVPSQTVICDDQKNVLNDKGKAALRFIFAYCK